jgi:1-deoxy-D-xylulose-5-phosphate reductoisomerase
MFITASGGPFLNYPLDALPRVTPKDALKHPVWQMGSKITIDSATMMNKGLEVIEASILFDIPIDRIEGIIHPESKIHGGVEFVDGSMQLAVFNPDMFLPALSALSYPQRLDVPVEESPLGFGTLTLERIDPKRFPCYFIALEAARKGEACRAILVGADEEAVNLFIEGKISFGQIPELIEKALDSYSGGEPKSLDDASDLVNVGKKLVKKQVK